MLIISSGMAVELADGLHTVRLRRSARITTEHLGHATAAYRFFLFQAIRERTLPVFEDGGTSLLASVGRRNLGSLPTRCCHAARTALLRITARRCADDGHFPNTEWLVCAASGEWACLMTAPKLEPTHHAPRTTHHAPDGQECTVGNALAVAGCPKSRFIYRSIH